MMKKIETNFFCKSNYWNKRMLKIKNIVENILNIKDLKFSTKNIYFLNFIFVDDEIIKKINNTFRKINKSTDVLTFVNFTKNHNSKTEVYCDIFLQLRLLRKIQKKILLKIGRAHV